MSRASKDFNSLPRLFTIIGFIDEFDHASLLLLPPPIDIISVQRPNITGAFYFIFFFFNIVFTSGEKEEWLEIIVGHCWYSEIPPFLEAAGSRNRNRKYLEASSENGKITDLGSDRLSPL